MSDRLKIGQEVLIHGYIDEIRKDTIIIQNEGGYFGTVECEVTDIDMPDTNDVLEKIRAEIEKTTSRYTISRERDAMGQVEWSDRLIKESEVLQIIDKYNHAVFLHRICDRRGSAKGERR